MYSIDHKDLGTPASASTGSVTLDIDGSTVTVPAGTSVMRAAALAGGHIPKLCATDTLKAFGARYESSHAVVAHPEAAARRG
ncbi:MAG: formate dehydrogenase, alpha subunit [Steroidobacteraceae bacterium]|nr:formate dehydrogenase, alpha subunit [Steroidobacteraceae bacterium]